MFSYLSCRNFDSLNSLKAYWKYFTIISSLNCSEVRSRCCSLVLVRLTDAHQWLAIPTNINSMHSTFCASVQAIYQNALHDTNPLNSPWVENNHKKIGSLYLRNCSATKIALRTNEGAFYVGGLFCGIGAWFYLINSCTTRNKSRIKFV